MNESMHREFLAMSVESTIVVKCLATHPPTFEVLFVNASLISEDNLAVGERLTESELDTLFDFYGDFGVEVIYEAD